MGIDNVGSDHQSSAMLYRRRLGKKFSEGARLVWIKLKRRKWTQAELARQLGGRDRGTVSHWLYGDTRPDLDALLLFKSVLKIPVEAWAKPPTEPFEPPGADDAEGNAETEAGAA